MAAIVFVVASVLGFSSETAFYAALVTLIAMAILVGALLGADQAYRHYQQRNRR